MAPEQIRGQDIGPPADIYAVGVLLYEMIVGRTPFAGGQVQTIIDGHLRAQVTAPKEIIPTCPDSLNDLVMWALEKGCSKPTKGRAKHARHPALWPGQ